MADDKDNVRESLNNICDEFDEFHERIKNTIIKKLDVICEEQDIMIQQLDLFLQMRRERMKRMEEEMIGLGIDLDKVKEYIDIA